MANLLLTATRRRVAEHLAAIDANHAPGVAAHALDPADALRPWQLSADLLAR